MALPIPSTSNRTASIASTPELCAHYTSAPIPKFATARRTPGSELRDRRTLANSMLLVRLLNLKFLTHVPQYDRNFKFAALVAFPRRQSVRAPRRSFICCAARGARACAPEAALGFRLAPPACVMRCRLSGGAL